MLREFLNRIGQEGTVNTMTANGLLREAASPLSVFAPRQQAQRSKAL